jgi:integrase/recombinase XerD
MNLDELFNQFVKEKTFLAGVTPKTVRFYRQSFKAYTRSVGSITPDRFVLNDFVIKLREGGMSPSGTNVYIRGMNSFLSWLWENNHIGERLKIKQIKEEKKIIQTYNETQLIAFLNWKPKTWTDFRMHALVYTLIDTGARIDVELLNLKRQDILIDDLLIKLSGKGSKQRMVPMSFELRKVLIHWLRKNEFELVFPTRDGCKQGYRNVFRDFKNLCKKLGLDVTGFHRFRHTFAVEYVRSGGNIMYLQKALGHSTLQMTRRYTELNDDDLKQMHKKTSILSRLK